MADAEASDAETLRLAGPGGEVSDAGPGEESMQQALIHELGLGAEGAPRADGGPSAAAPPSEAPAAL